MAGVNNRVKITNDIELKDRLVAINRVTKVTKGGRTFSFSAIVVVGNEEGIIGWGLGKAGEVTAAIAKGVESAKKNLVKVQMCIRDRTNDFQPVAVYQEPHLQELTKMYRRRIEQSRPVPQIYRRMQA